MGPHVIPSCHPRPSAASLREGKGTQVDGLNPVFPPGFPSLAARVARLAGNDISLLSGIHA